MLCAAFSFFGVVFIFGGCFSCSLDVHHTWVKQSSHSRHYPTYRYRRIALTFLGKHRLYLNEMNWNFPDLMHRPCFGSHSGMNKYQKNVFGQGLVCSTCAAHTNWATILSSLSLDLSPVLVGCSPLVWTLTSDNIFWCHSLWLGLIVIHKPNTIHLYQRTEQLPWDLQYAVYTACVCVRVHACVWACVCGRALYRQVVFLVYLHVGWAGQVWCPFFVLFLLLSMRVMVYHFLAMDYNMFWLCFPWKQISLSFLWHS